MEDKEIRKIIINANKNEIGIINKSRLFNKLISDKRIIQKYIKEDKSTDVIAKEFFVSPDYIIKRLKRLNLLRDKSARYKNNHNGNWLGKRVGYNGVHIWIKQRKIKPAFCERCKKNKPYDLANISGEYKRDVNDFEWICRSCHSKEHNWVNNFKKWKK